MITGPHGIGKTETAKELAFQLGYQFAPSVASRVAKKLRFSINNDNTLKEVLDYQYDVLEAAKEEYFKNKKKKVVYDRSPLDFLTYTALSYKKFPKEEREDYEDNLLHYSMECIMLLSNYKPVLIYPEADLKEDYPDKYNRPKVGEGFERSEYADLLLNKFSVIDTKKIVVPVKYQYEERVKFIMKELKNG